MLKHKKHSYVFVYVLNKFTQIMLLAMGLCNCFSKLNASVNYIAGSTQFITNKITRRDWNKETPEKEGSWEEPMVGREKVAVNSRIMGKIAREMKTSWKEDGKRFCDVAATRLGVNYTVIQTSIP